MYPWAGLLAKTGHPQALSVLDQCRIRTGTVGQVDGETATVRSRPLDWDGSGLSVGAPRSEIVRWSSDGRSLIDPPMPGDRVALHWDWVCDTITEEQCALIESYERAYHRGLAIS